jgi:hypothetical protein
MISRRYDSAADWHSVTRPLSLYDNLEFLLRAFLSGLRRGVEFVFFSRSSFCVVLDGNIARPRAIIEEL